MCNLTTFRSSYVFALTLALGLLLLSNARSLSYDIDTNVEFPDIQFQFTQISSGISYKESGDWIAKKTSTDSTTSSNDYSGTNSFSQEQVNIATSEIVSNLSGSIGGTLGLPGAENSLSIQGDISRSDKHTTQDKKTITTSISAQTQFGIKKSASQLLDVIETKGTTWGQNDGFVRGFLTIANNSIQGITLTKVDFMVFGVDPVFPEKKTPIEGRTLATPVTGTSDGLELDAPPPTAGKELAIHIEPHGTFTTEVFIPRILVTALHDVFSAGMVVALQVNSYDGLYGSEPLNIGERRAKLLSQGAEIRVVLGNIDKLYYVNLGARNFTLREALSVLKLEPQFTDGQVTSLFGKQNTVSVFKTPPALYSEVMDAGRWVIAVLDNKQPISPEDVVLPGTRVLLTYVTNLDLVKINQPTLQTEWFSLIQECSSSLHSPNPISLFGSASRDSVIKLEVEVTRFHAISKAQSATVAATPAAYWQCPLANSVSNVIDFQIDKPTHFQSIKEVGLTLAANGVISKLADLEKSSLGFHSDATGNVSEVFQVGSDFSVKDHFELAITTEPTMRDGLLYGRKGGPYSCPPGKPGNMDAAGLVWKSNNPSRTISIQEPASFKVRATLYTPIKTDDTGEKLLSFDPGPKTLIQKLASSPANRFGPCVWKGETSSDDITRR
jgi:hypothetical protein